MDPVANHLIAIADPSTSSQVRDDAIEAVLAATRPTWKKWGGHLEAEDVMQIARVAIWTCAPKYDPDRSGGINYASLAVRGKLKTIHRCQQSRRRGHGVSVVSLDEPFDDEHGLDGATRAVQVADQHDYLEEKIDADDLQYFLEKIIKALSPFEAKVLRLVLEDYTYREIATILDVKTKAIDNARERIRRLAVKYPSPAKLRANIASHVRFTNSSETIVRPRSIDKKERQSKGITMQPQPKDTAEIIDVKLALYDVIEAQGYLAHQNQQLESKKGDLAKKLGELRQAASDAAAK